MQLNFFKQLDITLLYKFKQISIFLTQQEKSNFQLLEYSVTK